MHHSHVAKQILHSSACFVQMAAMSFQKFGFNFSRTLNSNLFPDSLRPSAHARTRTGIVLLLHRAAVEESVQAAQAVGSMAACAVEQ